MRQPGLTHPRRYAVAMAQGHADITACIERDGYAVLEDVVERSLLLDVAAALEHAAGRGVLVRDGATYGVRDLMRVVPEVARVSSAVASLARAVVGPDAFVARALFFDKSARANWRVGWHQDVTIAVRERIEAPGFGPWSVKAGIHHVRPPPDVLHGMLTLRIHIDDNHESNGPLLVLPGTHARFLTDAQTAEQIRDIPPAACLVRAGGVVAFRPLLLHSSRKSTCEDRRRVIHLEFASGPLPHGLIWAPA